MAGSHKAIKKMIGRSWQKAVTAFRQCAIWGTVFSRMMCIAAAELKFSVTVLDKRIIDTAGTENASADFCAVRGNCDRSFVAEKLYNSEPGHCRQCKM